MSKELNAIKAQQPVAWRDHVEQRLLTWKQSFVNKSGDQLALDDFMDKQSLDDLIDFVCDEYTSPPAQQGITLDGMTANEFALAELYAFQEATGCDTAEQLKAQQQEPVAIDRLYIEALIEGLYQNEDPVSVDAAEEFERLLKTPASPPASKPWVELTEKEENELWEGTDSDWELMKRTEAKLREKNL